MAGRAAGPAGPQIEQDQEVGRIVREERETKQRLQCIKSRAAAHAKALIAIVDVLARDAPCAIDAD